MSAHRHQSVLILSTNVLFCTGFTEHWQKSNSTYRIQSGIQICLSFQLKIATLILALVLADTEQIQPVIQSHICTSVYCVLEQKHFKHCQQYLALYLWQNSRFLSKCHCVCLDFLPQEICVRFRKKQQQKYSNSDLFI